MGQNESNHGQSNWNMFWKYISKMKWEWNERSHVGYTSTFGIQRTQADFQIISIILNSFARVLNLIPLPYVQYFVYQTRRPVNLVIIWQCSNNIMVKFHVFAITIWHDLWHVFSIHISYGYDSVWVFLFLSSLATDFKASPFRKELCA